MKNTYQNQNNNRSQVISVKTSNTAYRLLISLLTLSLLSLLFFSCSNKKKETVETSTAKVSTEASPNAQDALASVKKFEIVPNVKVCMVNDMFMGIDQILVEVNGLNYYGCCEGCVEKLQENIDDVRFGSNPLIDKKVDKASAIIVHDKSTGGVFYFETNKDAQAFIDESKTK